MIPSVWWSRSQAEKSGSYVHLDGLLMKDLNASDSYWTQSCGGWHLRRGLPDDAVPLVAPTQIDAEAVRDLLAERSSDGALPAMAREPFPERYVVRIGWAANPEPLFRMRCYGVDSNVQYVDVDQSAEILRVRARELVCCGLGVALVDCPPNIDIYYDQAAVQRLTKGAS